VLGLEEEVRIVESVLFSAGRAISIDEIREATKLSPRKIRKAIDSLIERYNQSSSMEIVKAGKKYAMQLKSTYAERARTIAKPEIPFHILKTLAMIAYHQPIRQADLRKMLGPRVYSHVDVLISKKLINSKKAGTTEILTTSRSFPEYFGIDSTKPNEIREFLARRIDSV
jgi:segregation and condensation protein B